MVNKEHKCSGQIIGNFGTRKVNDEIWGQKRQNMQYLGTEVVKRYLKCGARQW